MVCRVERVDGRGARGRGGRVAAVGGEAGVKTRIARINAKRPKGKRMIFETVAGRDGVVLRSQMRRNFRLLLNRKS